MKLMKLRKFEVLLMVQVWLFGNLMVKIEVLFIEMAMGMLKWM